MSALSHPTKRGERVQAIRVLCGKTVLEFCDSKTIHLTKGSINHWESPQTSNGISKVGVNKIIARAAELGVICSFEWIMYGTGMPPVYDGGEIETALSKEENKFLESIAALCDHKRILHITVIDDVMAPGFQQGDVVIGVKQNKAEDALGKTCIVVTQEQQVLLRQLDPSTKHRSFTLRPSNPLESSKTLYDVKIKMAAPVVFHWRRYQT